MPNHLAMGQVTGPVGTALRLFETLQPDATWEVRDSIYELLLGWENVPAYFPEWPTADYEQIPFLSPKSAFSLGRYISETGMLQFEEEWNGVPLMDEERQCLRYFFTLHINRKKKGLDTRRCLGVKRSGMTWLPNVIWDGLVFNRSVNLGGLTLNFRPTSAPFILYRSESFIGVLERDGAFYLSKPIQYGLRLGIGNQSESTFGTVFFEKAGFRFKGAVSSHGYFGAAELRSMDGIQIVYRLKTANFKWPSSWSFFDVPPLLAVRIPYRRGHLLMHHGLSRSKLAYQDKRKAISWVLSPSAALIQGQYSPLPSIAIEGEWNIRANHFAWAIHAERHLPNFRWTGSVGAGSDSPGGFSRLRMSQPGFYLRNQVEWNTGKQRSFIRLSLRPSGYSIQGAYSLQLTQKSG